MTTTRTSKNSNTKSSHDTKEIAMTTTKTSHANHAPATSTATTSPATEAATPTTGTPTAASGLSPKTGVALIFLQPPPADAKIPSPPQGTDSPGGSAYRSYVPKAIEVAALPGAVTDLQRLASAYPTTLGVSGLPYAQVLQSFTVATAWTSMRKATVAWDIYSQAQEGIAWTTVRAMMVKLKQAWDVAVAGDASMAATYPNLAALFSAKEAISAKAASTRKLNKEAKAKGEAPIHGVVGKRTEKRLAKAALAASNASAAAATAGGTATAGAATPAVATVTAAPGATTGGATHS